MKPLDEPPLETEEFPLDGGWAIAWKCRACEDHGVTVTRSTPGRAHLAVVIIEANHGEGRCTR